MSPRKSGKSDTAEFEGVILLVGDDASALGALASRLRSDHGVRVGVFVGDPVAEDAAEAAVEMARELYLGSAMAELGGNAADSIGG